MRVGFLQFSPKRGRKRENLRQVRDWLVQAECDLVVLPELFNTGYLFESRGELWALAEEVPMGETTQALLELAAERDVAIAAGIAERCEDRLFNSAVLVTARGDVFLYRKLHLFGAEKRIFSPGDQEPGVFEIMGAKLGMMICFDWYFPETARLLMLQGAEIICHPANLVLPYCQEAMRTRCLENRVFAITANRIGAESVGARTMEFTGNSQVVDPLGKVLARASSDRSAVMTVEIDPKLSLDKQLTSTNDIISDRRVELYGRLLSE